MEQMLGLRITRQEIWALGCLRSLLGMVQRFLGKYNKKRLSGWHLQEDFVYNAVFSYKQFYFWIPLIAPYVGALLGCIVYKLFVGLHGEVNMDLNLNIISS